MNTKKNRQPLFQSKLVVKLWLFMMILVIIGIAFMWAVQIMLFEQNFIDSTVKEIQNRLDPTISDIKSSDLAIDDGVLSSLSRVTNGKMLLIDETGTLIVAYSGGHQLLDDGLSDSIKALIRYFKENDIFNRLELGQSRNNIVRFGSHSQPVALEVDIPVIYNQEKAVIVLYQPLDQLHTALQINRTQLIKVSILLTLVSALIAAGLSQLFIKPIFKIKRAVDQMTLGHLEAKSEVKSRDELGQLSDSVDQLGSALQRVDKLRKEVIANVSHELRSPLALIRGYAELVRDISWKDEKNREEHLNLIIGESNRMTQMVNDILDYSQVRSGYIALKKGHFKLLDLIESQVEVCQKEANAYGIEIDLKVEDPQVEVEVDAVKICQVLRNLLNNAINHTEDNERITVKVDKLLDKWRVSVNNPGLAISEEDQALIWERYQVCQHSGGRQMGTGIGLSIVKSYLEAHGFDYGLVSQEGINHFWFDIE